MKNVEACWERYLDTGSHTGNSWKDEDGCLLLGAAQMFTATGAPCYLQFLENELDNLVTPDGILAKEPAEENSLESVSIGRILFFMYDQTKEEKYRRAIAFLMERLAAQPRCACGSFWYDRQHPNQIRLDGLYMAQPFYMAYETRFHKKEQYNDILGQFENARRLLYDGKKGLYHPAWNEEEQKLENTGFRLRSTGLHLMALVDVMDAMSMEIFEQYKRYMALFKEALAGLLRYRDPKTGLFFQKIEKGGKTERDLETSGNAMVAYAILKGCRMGVLLREKYADIGFALVDNLMECKLTEREHQGASEVGPLLMACAQKKMLENEL